MLHPQAIQSNHDHIHPKKLRELSAHTQIGSTSSPTTPSPLQRNSPEQDSEDDVWEQDTYGEHPSDTESSDIRHLRRTHNTAGYRDGISASKEKSLQPGFDQGYSLGAVFGLKVGWVLGVLDGICAALAAKEEGESRSALRERKGEGSISGEWKSARRRWVEAKEALAIERLFAPPYWNADGTWAYEVKGEDGDEVTFVEVAEQHPVLAEWLGNTKREIGYWGIRERVFDGEEWEAGRIGQLDG